MLRFGKWLVALGLAMVASSLAAVELPDFARQTKFQSAQLSPHGTYLAVAVTGNDGRTVVSVWSMKDEKFIAAANFSSTLFIADQTLTRVEAGDYYWANDDRLIVSMAQRLSWNDQPTSTGNLFAMDADGGHSGIIFGPNAGEASTGSNLRKREATYALPRIIGRYDDDELLVELTPFIYKGTEPDLRTEVVRLNVRSGRTKRVAFAPLALSQFLADRQGHVRIAVAVDPKEANAIKVFQRAKEDDDWALLTKVQSVNASVEPVTLSTDGRSLLLKSVNPQGTIGIARIDLTTGVETRVADDPHTDVADVQLGGNGELLAVEFMPDRSRWQVVSDAPTAKLFAGLVKSFEGQRVKIVSSTDDDRLHVVFVDSDVNPGDFYLFDAEKRNAKYLFSQADWLDPVDLQPMTPITLAARDGLQLNGYLTLPKGEKPFPLVVMPHGGPYGVRDEWRYSSTVQALASRGYAVLQVNYRGSAGYGMALANSGIGQWGKAMEDDIADATRWAVSEGYASEQRVCLMGASYGGYAALWGLVRDPDLYRCAVAASGVYDLNLMVNEGDIADFAVGRVYLGQVLPAKADERAALSPVNFASAIKVPVLLAQGGEDDRVPPSHALAMRDALNKAGNPPEWHYFPNEGHGFYNPENYLLYLQAVTAFLDRELGTSSIANSAAAAP